MQGSDLRLGLHGLWDALGVAERDDAPSLLRIRRVSDLSQLSPQNHKHYIVICISGVSEILVTITVTTDSYTREMGVR